MNSFYVVLFVILAVTQGKSLITDEETVQVQLYYESLCPASRAFITTQLYPTFELLGSQKVNLELVPWGRASEEIVNGTRNFTCQHGPEECYGNKVQACVIDMATIEQSAIFVFCSEQSNDPASDANLQACAETVAVEWSDVEDCLSSGKADELLSENGKKTDLIQLEVVPTIVVDGNATSEIQHEAFADFKTLLCTYLGYPVPCMC